MKVSSISGNSIESGLVSAQHPNSFVHIVQSKFAAIMKIIDRIGTSIALGEKGDLDAIHEFRNKEFKAKN